MTVKQQVDAVFQRLQAGTLQPPQGPQDGWEMALPSGKTVTRSVLQGEARPLIALGPEAVPALLEWADQASLALRYVALYSLEQITGERPHVSYFDADDKEGSRHKAISTWRKWYQDRKR